MNMDTEWGQVQRLLTTERLSTYADLVRSSPMSVKRAYEWNARLSASFYVPLQGLEVALRNSIHLTLVEAFDDESWFDVLALNEPQLRAVRQVKSDFERRGSVASPPDIIAKLSFGFWVGLLGSAYSSKNLWNQHLHKAFPNGKLQRKECHQTLDDLRKFRNHIAHHEPVVTRNHEHEYFRILQVLDWISPATKDWVDSQSDVPLLLMQYQDEFQSGPSPQLSTPGKDEPSSDNAAPIVMGIVNVTPDSFSDGGRAAAAEDAIALARRHLADGAGLVDVGAESTRPGAEEVSVEEEWCRLAPVLEVLLAEGAPVSVDTRKAEIMRRALALGTPMINDVSALGFDPESMAVVADAHADIVLMHAQGLPADMQKNPRYGDVVAEVLDYLIARIEACEAAGIDRSRIVIDPGLGFGKTFQHNLQIMAALSRFKALGVRVLIGASRKGFIGWLTGIQQADHRLGGSIGAALAAVQGGADILRVHDVAETVQAVTVYRAALNGAPDTNRS